MARFIRVNNTIINLQEIRQVHFTPHITDATLYLDLGGKPIELNGSAAHTIWEKLLEVLAPDDWDVVHKA